MSSPFSPQAEGVELSELPPQPAEFTRVHVQGQFDHDASLYVGPRPRSTMGSATNGWVLPCTLPSNNRDSSFSSPQTSSAIDAVLQV